MAKGKQRMSRRARARANYKRARARDPSSTVREGEVGAPGMRRRRRKAGGKKR